MFAATLELTKAREKFPKNDDMLVALTEETGELANALLDLKQVLIRPQFPDC